MKPQAAHRRPKRSSDNDLRSEWLNSSSDDLRADAAATSSSPTYPLEGRGQAIKAKEPEARSADGGGDPVGDGDFFSRHHLSTDNGSRLLSGTIIRGTLMAPNSQLVTPISIKLQRPDGCD
jgi:hypothetical protein